jgi:DNA-binding PadR family transcriptional regulator
MSKLLINEHPLLVLPTLAVAIGLNEAIILQQVHYWLDSRTNNNFKEGKHWVYNTYSQWQEQFPFLSEVTIRRSIKSLESQGLLVSKNFNSNSFNKVKWYTINYGKLEELEDKLNKKSSINISDGAKRSYRSDQIDHIDSSIRSEDMINSNISNIEETKTTTEITTNTFLEQRRNIDDQMIDIWNEIVEKGNEVELSVYISKKLLNCYNKFLDKSLEKWHEFCQTIENNKFLNGEAGNFKATLLWSLEPKNTIKILEGYYRNDSKKNTKTNKEISIIDLKQEILGLEVPEFWKKVKESLLEEFGKETYVSWFRNLSFVKFEDGVLEIVAPSKFIAKELESLYRHRIEKICNKWNGKVKKIKIEY